MTGIRCMWMRGGTSKGAFFLASDLPSDSDRRDRTLLRLMGSPDPKQIDGLGGGHPLTSKVAVISPSDNDNADVDYLFLQVAVEAASVSDRQNCGNILSGVGPFAIERGLVTPRSGTTPVRIRMANSGGYATAHVSTPDGVVEYSGDTVISGVPTPAAAIRLDFADTSGSVCGALLPTGNSVDVIDGVRVTCVDNGMPVVVLAAADAGVTGYETCAELEADPSLRSTLESIRLRAGELMGLGDVTSDTIPKMTLIAPPRDGGTIATRTFIPHRCHASIGVLGAVSVATVCALPSTVASQSQDDRCRIEHPSGHLDVEVEVASDLSVRRSGVIRTARKLFDGLAFSF